MAVSITGTSGGTAHGETFTVTGMGFGTKSTAAPVAWDNCSGAPNLPSAILALWTGAWPNAGTLAYQMQYRVAPYRSILPPHNRVGQFMAGAHGDNVDYFDGWDVMVWKHRTISFPAYTYLSWYYRCDDNWVFGIKSSGADPADDNHKIQDYSAGTGPYTAGDWHLEYNPRPTSRTATPGYHVNDNDTNFDNDGSSTSFPNSSAWGANAVNPMSGVWTKIEAYYKLSNLPYTDANTGFLRVYENGHPVLHVDNTRTDVLSGTDRVDAVGGFSRDSGNGNNYRYFADLYLDYTFQHVSFGNASQISNCTVLEVQPVVAWSGTSITVTVNRGVFSDNAPFYIYVYDQTGTPNTAGFPAGGLPPAAPTGLQVR